MRDRMTGRPRGFGFVTYRSPESAEKAVVDLHVVDGRQASVFTVQLANALSPVGIALTHQILKFPLQIDVKKSVPQEGKPKACKVFVGGLSPETSEGNLDKTHFY